jgi:hypothetical protein
MAASSEEVQADVRVSKLSDDMLECRRKGHDWQDRGNFPEETVGKGKQVIVFRHRDECARCTTKKSTWWNVPHWTPIARSYDYPDGYQFTGEQVERGAINREWFVRRDPQFFAFLKPGTNGNGRKSTARGARKEN